MRHIAQHPHGTTLVPLKCQPNPPNRLTTLLITEPDRQTYAGVNTHLQKIVDALADQDSLVPPLWTYSYMQYAEREPKFGFSEMHFLYELPFLENLKLFHRNNYVYVINMILKKPLK